MTPSPHFPIFKSLDVLSKVPENVVNQQDSGKVSNFEH